MPNPNPTERWFVICPHTGIVHGPLFRQVDAETEAAHRCGDHEVHVEHMIVTTDPTVATLVLAPITYDPTSHLYDWSVLWICQRRNMIQGEML